MQNLSYENEFDLHENEPVGGTHFHMNGFARRLVLKEAKGNSKMACCQDTVENIDRRFLKIHKNVARFLIIFEDVRSFPNIVDNITP